MRPAPGANKAEATIDDPPVIDIALTPNRSSATADFLVYDGEPLSFDGSGPYDPDGGALTKHDWVINYTSGKPKDYAGVVFDTSYALANGSFQTMRLLIRDEENNYVSKTVTIEVVAAPAVAWKRTYFIRDHLGSVRVAFNEDGDVVEATDYYPFGLQMPTRSFVSGTGVKENYTGHELDAEIDGSMVMRSMDMLTPDLSFPCTSEVAIDQPGNARTVVRILNPTRRPATYRTPPAAPPGRRPPSRHRVAASPAPRPPTPCRCGTRNTDRDCPS